MYRKRRNCLISNAATVFANLRSTETSKTYVFDRMLIERSDEKKHFKDSNCRQKKYLVTFGIAVLKYHKKHSVFSQHTLRNNKILSTIQLNTRKFYKISIKFLSVQTISHYNRCLSNKYKPNMTLIYRMRMLKVLNLEARQQSCNSL